MGLTLKLVVFFFLSVLLLSVSSCFGLAEVHSQVQAIQKAPSKSEHLHAAGRSQRHLLDCTADG